MDNIIFNFFRKDDCWVYTVKYKDTESDIIKTPLTDINSLVVIVKAFEYLPNAKININFNEDK